MGWWWSRSDPQTPVTNPSEPTPDPVPISSQPPADARDVPDKPTRPLSRDEQADADLKSFLAELEASVKPTASPADASATGSTTSSQPAPPSIFPTTMSCRQAFDEAFYCQSLGGQFMNVYRYGGLRSCSENWNDFWFCMRTKSYGDAERAKAISEHYRQKEAKYRSGPSSEDVWEERKPGEELRNPFSKDPDEIEIPGLPRRKQAAGPA